MFFKANAVAAYFGPRRGSFHAVATAFALRLAYCSLLGHLGSPWMVLPSQLLHGFTFGLFWRVLSPLPAVIISHVL